LTFADALSPSDADKLCDVIEYYLPEDEDTSAQVILHGSVLAFVAGAQGIVVTLQSGASFKCLMTQRAKDLQGAASLTVGDDVLVLRAGKRLRNLIVIDKIYKPQKS
jgi:hypothetical protein